MQVESECSFLNLLAMLAGLQAGALISAAPRPNRICLAIESGHSEWNLAML